jgi:uncharacterized membrane protein YedE/YeeE
MSRFKPYWQGLSSLLAGSVFGVGLTVSQMTTPEKVLKFLDVTGSWDPSLLFVLGGAVVLTAAAYRWVLSRPKPVFDEQFHLPDPLHIDFKLISGAAVFGVGWGLAGYFPGPVIASLGSGNTEAFWVVPSLFIGVVLQRWQEGLPRNKK